MAISKEVEERFQKLESSINKHTYEYALCFDDGYLGGYLRLDKKTGIIDQHFDEEIPMDSKPFILLFPEILIYGLAKDIDSLDSINPFDKWYLQKAFNTINDEILMKRVKKLQRQWDKEEEDRRAAFPTPDPYSGPKEDISIKSNDNKPIEPRPIPSESKHTPEWQHDYRPNW
jgi:hypothetical protein